MTTIHIAVVDDCQKDRLLLNDYIKRFLSDYPHPLEIHSFESGEQFLREFYGKEYSLIFLDIFMEQGCSDGMQAAREIRNQNKTVPIIFSTSSPDFAIQGYLVQAAGYLLKPYTYEQFARTMEAASVLPGEQFIEVVEKRILVRVMLNDIVYCDHDNHYICIHTKDREIRSYMPFRELSGMLLCYGQFLCCYRNIIINMDQVEKLEPHDFIMRGDVRIPMRRQERTTLRQKYADYIFQKINGGGIL